MFLDSIGYCSVTAKRKRLLKADPYPWQHVFQHVYFQIYERTTSLYNICASR